MKNYSKEIKECEDAFNNLLKEFETKINFLKYNGLSIKTLVICIVVLISILALLIIIFEVL